MDIYCGWDVSNKAEEEIVFSSDENSLELMDDSKPSRDFEIDEHSIELMEDSKPNRDFKIEISNRPVEWEQFKITGSAIVQVSPAQSDEDEDVDVDNSSDQDLESSSCSNISPAVDRPAPCDVHVPGKPWEGDRRSGSVFTSPCAAGKPDLAPSGDGSFSFVMKNLAKSMQRSELPYYAGTKTSKDILDITRNLHCSYNEAACKSPEEESEFDVVGLVSPQPADDASSAPRPADTPATTAYYRDKIPSRGASPLDLNAKPHSCKITANSFKLEVLIEKIKQRAAQLQGSTDDSCPRKANTADSRPVTSSRSRKAKLPRKIHRCYHCHRRFESVACLSKHVCRGKTVKLVVGREESGAPVPRKSGSLTNRMGVTWSLKESTGRPEPSVTLGSVLPPSSATVLAQAAADLQQRIARTYTSGERPGRACGPPPRRAPPRKEEPAKSWTCEVCSHKFATADELSSHLRATHLKMSGHACELCHKSFFLRESLKKHMVVCHPDNRPRPWVCPQCSRAFLTKRNLTSHLSTHTGEKPFVCAECGRAFRRRTNMQQHFKAMHKGKHSAK